MTRAQELIAILVGLVFFAGIPSMCLWVVLRSWRRRVISTRFGTFSRETDPFDYWFGIGAFTLIGLAPLVTAALIGLDGLAAS